MKNFLYLVIFFLFGNLTASAEELECKYKKEFIDADLTCKGNGDCMFPRFQGLTSYEGDFSDYMDCLGWKMNKMKKQNKEFTDEKDSINNGQFYVNRGIERLDSGDRQGALSDFTEAINLNYKLSVNYLNRAIVKDQLKDYPGAISDSSKSIDVKPSSKSYVFRGKLKRRLGDMYGACLDWETAVNKRLIGSRSWSRSQLFIDCIEFYGGGKWSSYLGAFQDNRINQRWKNYNTYLANGSRKLQAADYAGSLTQFLKAKELYPNDPKVNENLGTVKFLLNDYTGALPFYDKAIEIFPSNSYLWFLRGLAKKEISEIQAACADYNRSISLADKEEREKYRKLWKNNYCISEPNK